ncbi:MAG: hypothetical protein ACXADB_06765 [Candidatus Hermodarchaeia archaeon]
MRKFDLLAVSWILLSIVALGSMAFGIVFAVLGTPPFILEFIGMDWSAIVAFSPPLASAFVLAQRLLGFAHIAIAITSLLVLYRHYQRDQRWAVLFLFIIMLPVWPPAWFLIPPAIPIAFWATIVLSVLWVLGVGIGALALKQRK